MFYLPPRRVISVPFTGVLSLPPNEYRWFHYRWYHYHWFHKPADVLLRRFRQVDIRFHKPAIKREDGASAMTTPSLPPQR